MREMIESLPAEALWMLISVGLFMALLGIMSLADDLLLWGARRREEKLLEERAARKWETPHLLPRCGVPDPNTTGGGPVRLQVVRKPEDPRKTRLPINEAQHNYKACSDKYFYYVCTISDTSTSNNKRLR